MHPAWSIIAFSTLSGAGYALAALLGLGALDPTSPGAALAHLLALAMIGAGLLSSTGHLRNPQRAWRAFSQWRSSWLSREAVLAVVTFLPITLSAAAALFAGRHLPAAGIAGALLAAATVYCTSMIYASLRSVDAWHTPLTPLCYLLFGTAGGCVLLVPFAAAAGEAPWRPIAAIAVLLLAAAAAAKLAWWHRLDTLRASSTTATATGLGALGRPRLFEPPHMTDNYLTREMGFSVARKHARKLRRLALVLAFALPAALLVVLALAGAGSWIAAAVGALAAASHLCGVVVERWLFFAEARHAVMNYYDARVDVIRPAGSGA